MQAWLARQRRRGAARVESQSNSCGEHGVAILQRLHVAEQDITLTREAVRLAGEDLRVIQARYRAGIATILDVFTSQTALIQAELDLVSARFTYQVARASLEALLGRDL